MRQTAESVKWRSVVDTAVWHFLNWDAEASWRTVVSDWRDWTSSSDFWRLGWRDFFVPTVLLSTLIPFFLPSSHAQVFGRTIVHEFLFSYSHTEWNLLFLKQTPLLHEATWDKPDASIKTWDKKKKKKWDARLIYTGFEPRGVSSTSF